MEHTFNDKLIWKTYGIWALWVGIAFFSIYPTCNWLTSQRSNTYASQVIVDGVVVNLYVGKAKDGELLY